MAQRREGNGERSFEFRRWLRGEGMSWLSGAAAAFAPFADFARHFGVLCGSTRWGAGAGRCRAKGAKEAKAEGTKGTGWVWLLLLLLMVGLGVAAACGAEVTHAISGETMGTTWSVRFRAEGISPQRRDGHREEVQRGLDRLEAQMSNYRGDSVVSRFNAARDTNWFAVPVETARVVSEALEISRRTEGAFDITVAPLVALWGFGPRRRTGVVPADAAIAAARARVGWRQLEVRATTAGVDETGAAGAALRKGIPDLEIDLGGIAKGFAAEVVSELLARRGVTNHLVGIGGDLRARGAGPAGEGWRVGIEQPAVAPGVVEQVVALRDRALSTSGNYRNFFAVGGKRYGHIIDPRTGWPVAAGVASVSVVAKAGARADALATGLLVLGADGARRIAEREGVMMLLLLESGDGRFSQQPAAEWFNFKN